jgi:hypothetical protein
MSYAQDRTNAKKQIWEKIFLGDPINTGMAKEISLTNKLLNIVVPGVG